MSDIVEKLWQKEGNGSSDCYVDLFAVLDGYRLPTNLQDAPEKCNKIADKHRSAGNGLFAQKKFSDAIEEYNRSLCFAKVGSESLSMSFANRSNCFLRLEEYDKCLRDIELAKNADYPQRLMPKLEQRKAQCLKYKATDKSNRSQPTKLSYEESANIPGMANVVKLVRNAEFGRHMVALEDIPVNKTILVEPYFVSTTIQEGVSHCSFCYADKCNLIPCQKCTTIMYCSDVCMEQDHAYHHIECGYIIIADEKLNMRSVLIGLDAFENVNELIDFVENVRIEDPDIPTSLSDPKSKYRAFLQLTVTRYNKSVGSAIAMAYNTFRCMKMLPKTSHLFETLANERFVMHLILMHSLRFYNNMSTHELKQGKQIRALNLVYSLINHQCTPNVLDYYYDGNHICTTMRPIKKGKQLLVKYIPLKTPNRRQILYNKFGFWCKCTQCVPITLPPHTKSLEKALFLQLKLAPEEFSEKKRAALKSRCIKLLNKYGHLPLKTLEFTSRVFGECIVLDHGY